METACAANFMTKFVRLSQLCDVPSECARIRLAESFTVAVTLRYWKSQRIGKHFRLVVPFAVSPLDEAASNLAIAFADQLRSCTPEEAGYRIGEAYSRALPPSLRSSRGVFFTPPVLTKRLIASVSNQGLDWKTGRILDTSCGGAAFLTPIALEMRRHLPGQSARAILTSIGNRLRGYEIDRFTGWLSQTLVEISLSDLCIEAGCRLPSIVSVLDTLAVPAQEIFDLVLGNPPYGRCSLSKEMRERYSRSLYGHANMYGLFTQAALNWTAKNGLIAYVTPTSMMGGKYFQSLRELLLAESPPVAIDFIKQREGVFASVQQETMLAVYRKGAARRSVVIHLLDLVNEFTLNAIDGGVYSVPGAGGDPWLLPRTIEQCSMVGKIAAMSTRLRDYGYRVSTGPMVFHRYPEQLRRKPGKGAYPIICAEAVRVSGRFEWDPESLHYKPFFIPRKKDLHLIRNQGCILVQRTTSKEQKRRLISAELPAAFLERNRGAIVENHLNMILPSADKPAISLATLSAILHADIVDAAFRCINGSVAVSASELEAIPLPSVNQAREIEVLVNNRATKEQINEAVSEMYLLEADGRRIALVA